MISGYNRSGSSIFTDPNEKFINIDVRAFVKSDAREPHFGKSSYRLKLEIWGKAQRESAWRPKSDWRKLGGGVKKEGGKISPASKSRGPNSNALAYAERALST